MPDFEALIRHQRSNQSITNDRLKVIDSSHKKETLKQTTKGNFAGMQAFFGGLLGSVIGTISIMIIVQKSYRKYRN